jgi:hypothetical protein
MLHIPLVHSFLIDLVFAAILSLAAAAVSCLYVRRSMRSFEEIPS